MTKKYVVNVGGCFVPFEVEQWNKNKLMVCGRIGNKEVLSFFNREDVFEISACEPDSETPNSKLISMDKKYTTRDGKPVKLLCTDNYYAAGEYPVVGIVVQDGYVYTWSEIGEYTRGEYSDFDLFPVN